MALVAVFALPYRVPVRPSRSLSYAFGFNNSVAAMLALLFSAICAPFVRKAIAARRQSPADSVPVPRSWIATTLACTFVLCLLMFSLVGRLGGFSESGYDIYRLYLASLGSRPYTGFEWPFGPALLYLPLWTARLLHADLVTGFTLVWFAASLLSVVVLAALVQRLRCPAGSRKWIFLILLTEFIASPMNLSLHYASARYTLPLLLILVLASRVQRAVSRSGTVVLAAASCAALLLLSPETGVAFAFAAAVLLFPDVPFTRSRLGLPAYAVTVLLLAAEVLTALRFGLFNTARASAGGADSLPLVPSPAAMLFLLDLAVALGVLFWRWSRPDPEDNTPALILLSLPLLPAAMARADPGHLFSNGLGITIAGLICLWPTRARRWWLALWALGYALPFLVSAPKTFASDFGFYAMFSAGQDAQPGHVAGFGGRFSQWALTHVPSTSFRQKETERLANAARYPVAEPPALAALYPNAPLDWPHTVAMAPLGYSPSHSDAQVRSPQIDLGFYQATENANTPAAIDRKIAELAAHPDRPVLIPGRAEQGAPADSGPTLRRDVTEIYSFPYFAHAKHLENLYAPLYTFLNTHYRLAAQPTAQNYGYELWVPMQH